jgi:hypothetical protein
MPRRWTIPVVAAALVVFAGGLAFGLVSSRADEASDDETVVPPSTTTAGATPTPTTAPPTPTTTAPAQPTPPEPEGPGRGGHRTHVGQFFTVEVPADWEAVTVDEDPGYSVPATRTTFEGDGAFLTIETQTPLTGTIEESCQSIFASVEMAEVIREPETKRVHGVEACSFEFVRPDGESRIDILFADGDRGFAVLAGSSDDYRRAKHEAEHAVGSIARTDG